MKMGGLLYYGSACFVDNTGISKFSYLLKLFSNR